MIEHPRLKVMIDDILEELIDYYLEADPRGKAKEIAKAEKIIAQALTEASEVLAGERTAN